MSKTFNNAVRLGVNIDHVATLRRLRETPYPDLLAAAEECVAGGADQITIHLREDRRHIVDADAFRLREHLKVDLNFEMAATDEMLQIALKLKPHSICVVPEKREERTTEGGLDLSNTSRHELYRRITSEATKANILVSFFIEPEPQALELSRKLGAPAVEIHTGALCLAHQSSDVAALKREWARLKSTLTAGQELGLLLHAGHGIDYKIAPELAAVADGRFIEYNIGHSLVCEAIYCGMREATRKMKSALLKTK